MKRAIKLSLPAAGVLPSALWAHTGEGAVHNGFFATVGHVLSEPDHLLILSVVLVGAPLLAWGLRRLVRRRSLRAQAVPVPVRKPHR